MANYTAQALSFKFGYYKVCGNMEKSNQYFCLFFDFYNDTYNLVWLENVNRCE